MQKTFFSGFIFSCICLFISCAKTDDPGIDDPDVYSVQVDSTLKSFYTGPDNTYEAIFGWDFNQFPLNLDCTMFIDLYWYGSTSIHGIYIHFNNLDGDVLMDNNGFVKAFDSGVTIDSTTAGTWSGPNDAVVAYDYVSHPSADSGNLAGKGDKYIAFSAHTGNAATSHLKHYGWMRVQVSGTGRVMKVLAIGFQKKSNTSLYTGEI
ncbi:MAG: hypothetical protein IPM95_14160 [Sphingobacteriales bacterium]|nr:hypothetical protein [Sphingobacteriales bacterium]